MSKVSTKVTLVITCTSNGKINISITDDSSFSAGVIVECTLEQFATALMHQVTPNVDCTFENMDRLGTERQGKVEYVPYKENKYGPEGHEDRLKALAPFEVDGWKGREEDLTNFHKNRGDGTYAVFFERWVKING